MRARTVPLEHTPILRVPGVGCNVELRRSTRAKRFSLKVSHTERSAILTLPNRGRLEDANAFLARHADWLKRQLERLPDPIPFTDGAIVPVRGAFHRLKFAGAQRNCGIVSILHDSLQPAETPGFSLSPSLRGPCCVSPGVALPQICISGDLDHAPRRFSDWLRSEVRRDIAVSVAKHAKMLACTPKRIAVRDQATRWGSCSTSGTLSFSWRLIFAPPFVLDYVAAHEVAHMREMNHSPRFWRLVKEAAPATQNARIWLKTHGAELHRFGSDY
ncbi:MAG: M48 family metallopeptidase [Rhodomicrobium sp.]